MEQDALIVLSGGMDSVTLLYDQRERIALAVNFVYGSNHNMRELACAREHCRQLGIELLEIHLDFMGEYFHSSLLEGSEAIPEGDYHDENMKSTVVPFRNGIMLATAAGLAESRGLRTVMLANHSGDHDIYPDCRPEFVDAMAHAIAAGTYEHIELLAPYTHMSKSAICARGHQLGVNYSLTYSCYKGGERHCGECGTCRERREAFLLAGVPDPTLYE